MQCKYSLNFSAELQPDPPGGQLEREGDVTGTKKRASFDHKL